VFLGRHFLFTFAVGYRLVTICFVTDRRTDRQTDRRHYDNNSRSHCVAARLAKTNVLHFLQIVSKSK